MTDTETPEKAPDVPAPPAPQPGETFDRLRPQFFRLLVAIVLLFFLGIGGIWLFGPKYQDFFLSPANETTRQQVINEMTARLAQSNELSDDDHAIAIVTVEIQRFAVREGKLPHELHDLELPEDFVLSSGYRLVAGGGYWRLYNPKKRIIARGN